MSAPPQTDERLRDLTWPGWLPLPPADGLVAVTPDQQARTAWADKVLGGDASGFVVRTGHRRRDRSPARNVWAHSGQTARTAGSTPTAQIASLRKLRRRKETNRGKGLSEDNRSE
jgi:hypothetical protein